ncbi:MAG TPA: L-lactate dehydrogenase [Gammaproteobacteria bacterium]|nr:L-lactate dehydrogenase [Gammaproteobacteria bacterium]
MKVRSSDDIAREALRRLPRFLGEYVAGGSYTEHTLRRNVEDLRSIELRQRVLSNVAEIDTTAELFGRKWSLPLGLGPIGISGMLARRGETQAARAAENANVPFCLSTVSICSLEEVRAALTRPFWFQLYVIRDRAFMVDLLDRAAAAGCSALLFTVDMPVPGVRYRDFRTGLAGSAGFAGRARRVLQAVAKPRWSYDVGVRGRPHSLGNLLAVLGKNSGLEDYIGWLGRNFDPSVTWKDLDWIRAKWNGPLIIKGILDPEDARRAVELGADGIVVSNHGGRQFDGVRSTVRALPPIAQAVDGKLTVLVDGGVRNGVDVLRMLALGANGVLLGRAWAFALAAGGRRSVEAVIDTLGRELGAAMAMAGRTSISELDRSVLDL